MLRRALPSLLLLLALVTACGDDEPPQIVDTGVPPDAGPDATTQDGSPHSDATADAGDSDAGQPDASGPPDFEWPVPTSTVVITPSIFWKNEITTPDDPFLSPRATMGNEVRWVKFAVLMRDPSKVYYQDVNAYPFHYEFAVERLDPFMGMSREDFDAVSLHETGQEVILGAVLLPPRDEIREYGVQLVRQDAYHPEMVRIVFELVRASVHGSAGTQPFYFPVFEQAESAMQYKEWFAQRNIMVSSVARWSESNACYAGGWALGRLVSVPAAEIDTAYQNGTLTPRDILLTDAVPAEMPYVAGILTTAPSTPNSHVAILAKNYRVPFAFLALEEDRDRAQALVGKEIVLRVDGGYACSLRLIDVDGALAASTKDEILALKDPPALQITPKAAHGNLSSSVDGLTDSDIQFFGGKASNFGLLRRTLPNNSPAAIALSFDLWDGFMDQTMTSNKTLRQEIAERLAPFTYPPDMAALDSALSETRLQIRHDTVFTAQQEQDLLAAVNSFDPMKKLRFRSSTNVEDSDAFTGAGLYDSYSACLADDLDNDSVGPSLCNASKPDERGAFRAIRWVFASFYNNNAFLERLRHQIDESQVGMAILVHHSFPDADELANGVAAVYKRQYSTDVELVTQLGAVSVTNPESSAVPEVVSVYVGTSGIYPTLEQRSSLVPLGDYVMDWQDDYIALTTHLAAVTEAYATSHASLTRFQLDLEYKKMKPADLIVKQVRPIPMPDNTPSVPIFLVNDPVRYCTFQGEYGDAIGNHRVKTRVTIETQNLWLTESNLQSSFYASIDFEYLDGTSSSLLTGDPATWTSAAHRYENNTVIDSWSEGGTDPRTFSLEVGVELLVRPSESPLRTMRDHYPYLWARYNTPVAGFDWQGLTTVSSETVRLGICPEDNVVTPDCSLQERRLQGPQSISVTTSFYWPPPPTGITAGYTAPLHQWVGTTISGLTAQPIELTGYYSQTYRPGHHNFSESFVFDPWLEPGIDQAILNELQTNDVRFLFISTSNEFWVMGLDGQLRLLQ